MLTFFWRDLPGGRFIRAAVVQMSMFASPCSSAVARQPQRTHHDRFVVTSLAVSRKMLPNGSAQTQSSSPYGSTVPVANSYDSRRRAQRCWSSS